MQRGALYIRVSTEDQIEFSPDAQKRALLEYAEQQHISIAKEHIFIDEGISGRSAEKRPAFLKMIALAKSRPKPFELILVHKFDRFSRSREDSVVYKSLLRKECGIKVVSISEQMEDDKFSVILEAMLEAMAEYYSLNLSDEVIKGMSERARKGYYQAGAPLGYDMVNGSLVINPDTSRTVQLVFDLYLKFQFSEFAIARYLNEAGYKTKHGNFYETRSIQYILQNPVYCGYIKWSTAKKVRTGFQDSIILEKGFHEPIISEETFLAVKEKMSLLNRPKKSRSIETHQHWLSGILHCSNCGSVLVLCGKDHRGFQCSHYAKGTCSESHYVSVNKIESAVLDAFQSLKTQESTTYTLNKNSNIEDTLNNLNHSMARLKQKEKRAHDAYINGIDTISDYRDNREALEKERNNLQNKMDELKNNSSFKTDCSPVNSIYDILNSTRDTKMKSLALQSICEKIIYDKKNEVIDIYLYYS